MTEHELKQAHGHTLRNRHEIERSDRCGCISCKQIFAASEVDAYIDDNQTVLCPYCGIDAVIGEASGIELTANWLAEMNKRYFQ